MIRICLRASLPEATFRLAPCRRRDTSFSPSSATKRKRKFASAENIACGDAPMASTSSPLTVTRFLTLQVYQAPKLRPRVRAAHDDGRLQRRER